MGLTASLQIGKTQHTGCLESTIDLQKHIAATQIKKSLLSHEKFIVKALDAPSLKGKERQPKLP